MKISRFITRHSLAFLIGMLVLCVVCACLITKNRRILRTSRKMDNFFCDWSLISFS